MLIGSVWGRQSGVFCKSLGRSSYSSAQKNGRFPYETPGSYFPWALVLKYAVGVVPNVFLNIEMNALGVL